MQTIGTLQQSNAKVKIRTNAKVAKE